MNAHLEIRKFVKNRTLVMVAVATLLLTTSLILASRGSRESAAAAAVLPVDQGPTLIAGPGRVEPFSEDIKIGSELSGRLKSVNVEEGVTIHRGQVLAELENADYVPKSTRGGPMLPPGRPLCVR